MAVRFMLLLAAFCSVHLLVANCVEAQMCDSVSNNVDSADAIPNNYVTPPKTYLHNDNTKLATEPREGEHDLHLGNCDELSEYFYDVIRCEEPVFNDTIYTITQYRFAAPLFIYCVNVTDLVTDGTGGYPTRYEGGLYQSFIDILFMSQVSQGTKFNVQVYAKTRE